MTKPVLMLLSPRDFREIEYLVPRAFFEAQGLTVRTTSTEFESVGRFGYQVVHDCLLDEVDADQYAALFIVGGSGALSFIPNETAKHLTMTLLDNHKPVVAICAAPRNFLAWGVLNQKKATGHNWDKTLPDLCALHGAIYQDQPVVVDGLVVTGQGPEAAEACALALLDLLDLWTLSQKINH